MQTTTDRLELARGQAFDYAIEQGGPPSRAEDFAGEYVCVLEDRATELRYPDLPAPTPEEVWFS
ncbi:hypothetical protein ACLQ2Q_20655 [Microbacterium sp. DT81.1]|uniref:hypothetical protein n=1 Tax=Microbacterium sp. DT81.1 TaxID=3393413 RepID=UPI003CEDD147